MKRYLSLLCLFFGFTAFAQDPILVINDTEELTGDPISIVIGKRRLEPIKDINGINQGVCIKKSNDDYRDNWFGDLGITIWRGHDMTVDPGLYPFDHNHIFPIETADPSKRENYDFSTTDLMMKDMAGRFGMQTLWRMGSTIENMDEYHYEIHPPQSAKRWAEVAVNILEHYCKGKWDGFYYDIPYVEIWNEPDNRHCWSGTMDEFTDFYITASKIIKKKCPWIKVGGPAFCSHREKPMKPFIEAVADAGAPLDFISYHWYVFKNEDDSIFLEPSGTVRKWMDDNGFKDSEIFFDEWHPISGWKNVKKDLDHDWSVVSASIMLGFQDSFIDKAFFYTGSTTQWGYFTVGKGPNPIYYAAKAVGEIRRHPTRLELNSSPLPKNSRALASIDKDGNAAALLALYKGGKRSVTFDYSALGKFASAEVYLFDKNHNLERIASSDGQSGRININTGELSSVVLLKLNVEPGPAQSHIRIADKENGTLKVLNGGNNGPSLKSRSIHFKTKYYNGMKIPITRVSNECRENSGMRIISTNQIFPLQTADPTDRSFYDFRASDDYLNQIEACGSEFFYCLSAADERLIEREHFRIAPPDAEKWKLVCENIIRHFNEGKWDGRRDKIRYWEIWDEPDNPGHWGGTLEQYFDLYITAASYLKKQFPNILVGGPCFGKPTEDKVTAFLSACKKAGAPLDFFSYKLFTYQTGDFERFACSPDKLRELLDAAGFKDTKIILSAWHPVRGERDDYGSAMSIEWATLCSSLIARWQDHPLDLAMFESVADKVGGVYLVPNPNPFYYMFVALADLMEHPVRLALEETGFSPESTVLAGKDKKGNVDLLFSLHGEKSTSTEVDYSALGKFSSAEIYLMDNGFKKLGLLSRDEAPGGKIIVDHPRANAIILVKLKK